MAKKQAISVDIRRFTREVIDELRAKLPEMEPNELIKVLGTVINYAHPKAGTLKPSAEKEVSKSDPLKDLLSKN